MADLKPLGSEKLNGDEKLKRILELTYYKNNNKKESSLKAELVKESKTGGIYGIVKEKDGYYVKRGLNEQSLDYIGGMFMKNKNKFTSYAEAFKRLELLKGQEELQEATKYVLKQSGSKSEAPIAEPAMDALPAPDAGMETPAPDAGGEVEAPDALSAPDAGGEMETPDAEGGESKRSDYMAEVQKYAGKLGQELRDLQEKMESDDIKYVLNMIISAVDLDKLEDEDIEEIGKKFERDEEEGGEEMTSPEDSEVPAEEPSAEEPTSDDLGETMDALEKFINTPIDEVDEVDLSNYTDSEVTEDENPKNDFNSLGHADLSKFDMGIEADDDIQEIDLEEIKNDINQAIGERLSKYFK
jgi:hypothetical protein